MALRQASAERDGSRGATAGTGRAGCGPIVEVPRSVLSTLKARFVSSAQTGLETALLAGRPHRGIPSEAADVDHGQFVYPSLKDCPVVVDLHELSPVGGWPAGGRHGRRLERFAEVCQELPSRGRSHPGLLPLANLRFEVSRLLPAVSSQPDVATTPRALQRKLLAHPCRQFGPGDPGGVVGARFAA